MGYYTKYDISFYDAKTGFEIDRFSYKSIELMKRIIAKIDVCDIDNIGSNDAFWYFDEELKWYDHHKHMTDLALEYPDIIFVLAGKGEERDDVWVKYYHGEKFEAVYAKLIYPQPQDPAFKNLKWEWEAK